MQPRPGILILALGLVACGGADGSNEHAAAVPTRSGDVWELDTPDDRTTAPAAMAAFVNGVHVVIVDGNDVYAGTEKRNAKQLGLSPDGDRMTARLTTGETVRLRRQAPRPEPKR
ncbi:MAG: hypothetical protein ABI625_20415 [bacterium]